MDYEQLYKEALERARVYWETDSDNTLDIKAKGTMEHLFPELAESEEKKVIKELISIVKSYRESCITEGKHRFDNCLAWLEKLKVFVEHGEGIYYFANSEFTYVGNSYSDVSISHEKQGQKKYIEDLTQQEAMDIAVAKCFEQGKQKSAWSEEDGVRLQACIDTLQAKSIMGKVDTINTNWLKSLKQRCTWKPSKEQMDAMQMAVSYFGYSWASKEQKLLESLYKDLKKL